MMRQGMVQDLVADMNAPLPPLNNLPQWARVGALDRARYPRPFLKDRLQVLPNPSSQSSVESDDKELDIMDNMNPMQRVQHLERSVNFLRSQHHEVLSNLHDEIDVLKRENKELQFRIVMMQKSQANSGKQDGVTRQSTKSDLMVQDDGSGRSEKGLSPYTFKIPDFGSALAYPGAVEQVDQLKTIFLEEEIRELKNALKEEQNRNYHLTQLLEQMKTQQRILAKHQEEQARKQAEQEQKQKQETTKKIPVGPLPYEVTTGPLQVHPTNQPPRAPTLQECDVIVRHLQSLNEQQAHELSRLKTDLRDVLYSHKWTPDAYLLAKAYVAEDDAKEAAEQQKLPKIEMKNQTRKLPELAYVHQDSISLPALRQTMGNKAVERRKRTQILQKSRIRREVQPPAGIVESSDA